MLGITGIIVILIQFLIDGYTISLGTMKFHSFFDIFGHFIFGIVGIGLFLLERSAYIRKSQVLSRSLHQARKRLKEYGE